MRSPALFGRLATKRPWEGTLRLVCVGRYFTGAILLKTTVGRSSILQAFITIQTRGRPGLGPAPYRRYFFQYIYLYKRQSCARLIDISLTFFFLAALRDNARDAESGANRISWIFRRG